MADTLSPAGSSTYSSNTMYVGDGTWDSTKNTFLLPNLQGLNLATTQYNGMGSRFSTLDQYHSLIKGHGVLAVITFLIIVPAAIFIHRFNTRGFGFGERWHIYLQILTLLLSTVVLVLGWFAVGPERSLTNPHHGIGVAIYTLIWVQALGGMWVRRWKRNHIGRRISLRQMGHQWLGRATALLGIAQVPLGLALYGSPTWTFIVYAIWMAVLVLLYFVLQYRLNGRPIDESLVYDRNESGRVIQEKDRGGGFMSYLTPILAGGAAAALLGRNKNKNKDRDDVTEYTEYTNPRNGSRTRIASRSRAGSRSRVASRSRRDSYVERETYVAREREPKEGGGLMQKLGIGAGLLGVGAFSKRYFDKRNQTVDDRYSAVEPDTPSRHANRGRHGRSGSRLSDRRSGFVEESEVTETTIEPRRDDRNRGPILPGPGDPVATAAALSAAEARPKTPRPRDRTPVRSAVGISRNRADSYSSFDSLYDSPSRRKRSNSNNVGKGILGGMGLGWFGSKFKGRREKKEQDRIDAIRRADEEEQRRQDEQARRNTGGPPRRSTSRRNETMDSDMTSDMSSSILDPPPTRLQRVQPGPSNLGPVAAAAAAGTAAAMATSRSRHDIVEPVPIPSHEPRASRTEHSESGTESGIGHRESRRRKEEAAIAAAAGTTVALAAEEERRRQRETHHEVTNPGGISLHLTQHHDKHRNITLRRLTEEEAAASRNEKRRSRRGSSVESMSATEAARGGRYRRNSSSHRDSSRRRQERREEVEVETHSPYQLPPPASNPPPAGFPLEPPRPAFAGGKKNRTGAGVESGYYSGTPGRAGGGSEGSQGSHGTWSAMSPSATGGGGGGRHVPLSSMSGAGTEGGADERRKRRRAERSGRDGPARTNTVEFE